MGTDADTRSTADRLRAQAGVVGQDVQELGRIARDAVKERLEQGKERASDLEKTIEEQIRKNPISSVLIAAGAGLLLGALLRRR
jgi:ElaB/YqjD/DUF883 family membrane-anchored ribosome-binding protein